MIREATVEDRMKIAEIGNRYAEKTLLGNLNQDQMQALIDHCQKKGIVLVAQKGDRIIGILAGHFIEGFGLGKFFEEVIWFVDEGSRGVGLGMFRRIQRIAKDAGCSGISMTAYNNEHLEAVENLYNRDGFEMVEAKYYKKFKGE